LRRVRGLAAALTVAIPAAMFLLLWMHATREFGLAIACGLGLAIFAVVATGTDPHDAAADAAWQAAAPDLPPVVDRATLERDQASMPGPEKPRRGAAGSTPGRDRVAITSSSQQAESK
jgi:hypothetical protein